MCVQVKCLNKAGFITLHVVELCRVDCNTLSVIVFISVSQQDSHQSSANHIVDIYGELT